MKLPPRKFIYGLLIAVLFGMAIYAFFIEPNRLVVVNYNLRLNKWSPKLNGLKIVAISDIHGGSNFVTEEKIQEVVAQANAQNPDIIVLLGDYLSRSHFQPRTIQMPIETVIGKLRGLQAKYGVYAILGNQDNEFGGESVRQELEKIGCRVLENEIAAIEKNGEKLRILGVHDILKVGNNWNRISQDLKDSLNNFEVQGGNLIVLTHNPDSIVYMSEELSISKDTALLIAGHTHGGQCRFPIIGSPIVPSEFGQKYAAGFIQDKGIEMFVTTGIGMSYLPVRFGVPPEISVLEIYSQN